jgi:hypothetical protein
MALRRFTGFCDGGLPETFHHHAQNPVKRRRAMALWYWPLPLWRPALMRWRSVWVWIKRPTSTPVVAMTVVAAPMVSAVVIMLTCKKARPTQWAEVLGGLVLIAVGATILLQHLGQAA